MEIGKCYKLWFCSPESLVVRRRSPAYHGVFPPSVAAQAPSPLLMQPPARSHAVVTDHSVPVAFRPYKTLPAAQSDLLSPSTSRALLQPHQASPVPLSRGSHLLSSFSVCSSHRASLDFSFRLGLKCYLVRGVFSQEVQLE